MPARLNTLGSSEWASVARAMRSASSVLDLPR
jgi:hypothetical protein